MLPLDTELDRLVASCTNAFSCLTDVWRETEYYAHTDPSGNSHFYKTGSKVPWEITPAMEEWMAAFPRGAGREAELGTVCHEMLASPRARAVAERLCGIKFMSRRAPASGSDLPGEARPYRDPRRRTEGGTRIQADQPRHRRLSTSRAYGVLRDRGGAVLGSASTPESPFFPRSCSSWRRIAATAGTQGWPPPGRGTGRG